MRLYARDGDYIQELKIQIRPLLRLHRLAIQIPIQEKQYLCRNFIRILSCCKDTTISPNLQIFFMVEN